MLHPLNCTSQTKQRKDIIQQKVETDLWAMYGEECGCGTIQIWSEEVMFYELHQAGKASGHFWQINPTQIMYVPRPSNYKSRMGSTLDHMGSNPHGQIRGYFLAFTPPRHPSSLPPLLFKERLQSSDHIQFHFLPKACMSSTSFKGVKRRFLE